MLGLYMCVPPYLILDSAADRIPDFMIASFYKLLYSPCQNTVCWLVMIMGSHGDDGAMVLRIGH